MLVGNAHLLLYGRVRSRQEDDLAVRALGHGLHGLQIPDLHGRRGAHDVCGLAHEFGGLDFGPGGDDLGLSDPLALRRHGQRLLELVAEDDVFDQHALDLHAPTLGHILYDLADALRDFLATLDDILEDAGADDVPERGLRALDERLADVGDAKGGLVGGDDVVVDDGGEVQRNVVFGHADLLPHLDDLDLDVDLHEALGEGVDLDEARVDSAVEAAELGDQADVALVYGLVGVRADDAARDGAAETEEVTQGVDCEC